MRTISCQVLCVSRFWHQRKRDNPSTTLPAHHQLAATCPPHALDDWQRVMLTYARYVCMYGLFTTNTRPLHSWHHCVAVSRPYTTSE